MSNGSKDQESQTTSSEKTSCSEKNTSKETYIHNTPEMVTDDDVSSIVSKGKLPHESHRDTNVDINKDEVDPWINIQSCDKNGNVLATRRVRKSEAKTDDTVIIKINTLATRIKEEDEISQYKKKGNR